MLLWLVARSVWRSRSPVRALVFVGCGALAVGTLQGPVQAFPAVNELLDESGDAGDVIVNLHAQLNMLGGLMPILLALALAVMRKRSGEAWPRRHVRTAAVALASGMGVYYAAGVAFAAAAAAQVRGGTGFGRAVDALEPWPALVLAPAALAVGVGFGAYALAAWRLTDGDRREGRARLQAAPELYTGRIPRRVRRLGPGALAAYELPMGLLGFPGVGWLFAGFPVAALLLLTAGPALAWAVIPLAFSPFGEGPLRHVGWQVEFAWLPLSALLSAAMLYRTHRRRLARVEGPRRPARARRRHRGSRAPVIAALGMIALVLVALPLVPAVTGVGLKPLRYSYETRFTKEITGAFLTTPRGKVRLLAWRDPQSPYPADALRVHAERRRWARHPCGGGGPSGRLPAVRRRSRRRGAARRAAALAHVARGGPRAAVARRAVTCSSPPTRACSAIATSSTSAWSRREPPQRRSGAARDVGAGGRERAAADRGVAPRRAVHDPAAALAPAATGGPEAAVGGRVRAVRGGDGEPGPRPGLGLERGAVPQLLPLRGCADGRLAGRRLGLAAALAAPARRARGRPRRGHAGGRGGGALAPVDATALAHAPAADRRRTAPSAVTHSCGRSR